jgi:hypothetical protein
VVTSVVLASWAYVVAVVDTVIVDIKVHSVANSVVVVVVDVGCVVAVLSFFTVIDSVAIVIIIF